MVLSVQSYSTINFIVYKDFILSNYLVRYNELLLSKYRVVYNDVLLCNYLLLYIILFYLIY